MYEALGPRREKIADKVPEYGDEKRDYSERMDRSYNSADFQRRERHPEL